MGRIGLGSEDGWNFLALVYVWRDGSMDGLLIGLYRHCFSQLNVFAFVKVDDCST